MAENQPRSSIVKIVGASMAGTTVEWYDFFLYGVAAALVFPQVFFPGNDPATGTLLSLGTFAVGFIARPVGGLVFGHYGDKIGRKTLLVVSLLMMGVATFLIGVLPGYATIGLAAPIILVLLRLVQGFALGGEWGGAVLIVSEHGDPARRGYWASWPQAGAPGGQLLANGILALLAAFQSEADFLAWGWRIPFLLSAVLVLIGLYIRLSVEESPVFREAQRQAEERAAAGTADAMPILEVLRSYPREVLTAMGARFAENVSYYIFTIVVTTYATTQLGLSSSFVLGAVLIGAAVHFVTIPVWGALSDRFGRKPLYILGAAGVGIWAFAFIALLDTRNFGAAVLAVVGGLLFHGAMYGPQAAFLSELFGTKVRYSGVSIGYQLASILAGGLAPIIAVALITTYGSGYPVAVYVAASAVLTIIAVASYSETRHRDLADDPALPKSAAR
ncbi:MFS transporter [Pseudonocardia broussonetiae]|uniref:Putative proline/betaine transporter n=1 Tax=Pseudonocardia broussonetiae TaxID=2736640 RepID=A0A6M6JKG8_9PSEU|nr:MFS transporter [Pseudonocardia broussonetiae]QJY47132.1 MHS family MFS transporter [Pseudonocardia broussonetiae]